MKAPRFISRQWFLAVVVAAALGMVAAGCGSTEPENVSSRPWNSPEGWQGGTMQGMTQPH
jgi:hypothetical protein